MKSDRCEVKSWLLPVTAVALLAGTTACSHTKPTVQDKSSVSPQPSSRSNVGRTAKHDKFSILFAENYQIHGVYDDPISGPESLTAISKNVPSKPTDVVLTNIHCNDDSGISGTVNGYIIGNKYSGDFDISGDEVIATGECAHGGTRLDPDTNAGLMAEFLLGSIIEQTKLVVPSAKSSTDIG